MWEKNQKRVDIRICITDSFAIQQKITYCKSIIPTIKMFLNYHRLDDSQKQIPISLPLEAEKSEIEVQQTWSGKAHSDSQNAPSHCVVTWWKHEALLLCPFVRALIFILEGSTSTT